MGYLKQAIAIAIAGALAAPAVAASLSDYIAVAELAPVNRPAASVPFDLAPVQRQGKEAGVLDLALGDPVAEAFLEAESERHLLTLRPKDPSHEVQVRQRSVIYLNLSDDGPHWPVPGTEQRGPWQPAARRAAHRFEVGALPEPVLKLSRQQLVQAVLRSEIGKDPRWVALARRCPAPDQGPCYTVTDSEYEVSVSHQGRLLARGVLRVRQPDGC